MNISDLSGLESLNTLNGNLWLQLTGIESLHGIPNLTRIGGTLQINAPSRLSNLQGLENIRHLGAIHVGSGGVFKNFKGLSGLDSISGNFTLTNGSTVDSIIGIENLEYIGGDISINRVSMLKDLSGFYNLKNLGGKLNINFCGGIETLYGLGALETVESVSITQNNKLTYCNIQSICNMIVDDSAKLIIWANGDNGDDCFDVEAVENNCGSTIDGFDFYSQSDIDQFGVQHDDIKHIIGTVNIQGNDIVDLSPLSNIEYVGGPLRIRQNPILSSLDGLNQLTGIGRDLIISNNDTLNNIQGLENLSMVNRNLDIDENQAIVSLIGLDKLTEVNGMFRLRRLYNLDRLLALSQLKKVNGDLLLVNLDKISTLEGLESLDTISDRLTISYCNLLKDIQDLDPLYIGDVFSFSDNDAFIHFDGFNSLNKTGGISFTWNDSLELVRGFNSLEEVAGKVRLFYNPRLNEINGFNDLVKTDIIDFSANDSLKTIIGFESLQEINMNFIISGSQLEDLSLFSFLDSLNYVRIFKNYKLTNIDFLENLKIANTIRIDENDLLTDITGLESLEQVNWSFYINDNKSLSDCNVLSICNILRSEPEIMRFANNRDGCNSRSEINCSFYGFSGYAFFDINQNGIQDIEDPKIKGVKIINEESGSLNFTNSDGNWYETVDEGTTSRYALYEDQNWVLTSDSSSYTRTFIPGEDSNRNLIFGVFPKTPQRSVDIRVSSGLPRCNSIVPFYVSIYNDGAYETGGEISITHNEIVYFDSTSIDSFQYDIDILTATWPYHQLLPFQSRKDTLFFMLENEDFIGESINMTGSGYVQTDSSLELNDDMYFSIELRCSFDPNDKLVSPVPYTEEHYTLKDEMLYFTVRFQNTGNLEALEVLIMDTIDNNLDLSTFEVLRSSHRLYTSLSEDGVVSFLFENILLPDSTSDPEGSQGFVEYRVQPFDNLPDFTKIYNTAYIHFDGNSPIITNTTINNLVESFSVAVGEKSINRQLNLFPNPVNDYLIINDIGPEAVFEIYDMNGVLVKKDKLLNNKINCSSISAGNYLIRIIDKNDIYYQRFIKI
jgi:uncharacterized repeat protein (TIGR01451 family)